MIGITLLIIPQNFAMYGFYTGALGVVLVFVVNSISTYLIIKARNVFKRQQVTSLSDLAVLCYGDKAKLPMDIFVIAIQFSFLFAYNIFLGDQLDQILCKILMVTECGKSDYYKVIICLLLLPFVLQKSLKNVALFSIFALASTLVSIAIVLGLETEI